MAALGDTRPRSTCGNSVSKFHKAQADPMGLFSKYHVCGIFAHIYRIVSHLKMNANELIAELLWREFCMVGEGRLSFGEESGEGF